MSYVNGQLKRSPDSVLDDGGQIARLMRRFYPQLIALAWDAANEVPGISVTFDLDNPFVQGMVDVLARNVRRVADTTRDQIAELVGESAREGWSSAELADRIRELGFTESISRSMAIARTESASAYTGGSLSAYQASGVVTETEWLIGPDSCDICQSLNGSRAPLGDEFAPGIIGPPAHPNCTCALSPIVE